MKRFLRSLTLILGVSFIASAYGGAAAIPNPFGYVLILAGSVALAAFSDMDTP